MSERLIARLGPLPRTHGMLDAMLQAAEPYRTEDIHDDPRFRGWWPAGHPDMRSFLGVPILAEGGVIGAFYLTEKLGSVRFDDEDQALIELLAAHAAIAITNARLYERSHELSILSERNRLALELHDVVSQKLFALILQGEVVLDRLESDPAAARSHAERVVALAREAQAELRSLIMGLRPAELARDGVEGALRKEIALLAGAQGARVELVTEPPLPPPDARRDLAILRIVDEALHNALRHAGAQRIAVHLSADAVEVADDGHGFDPADPALRSRHLGLTSMEERAGELGGRLTIASAPGTGTTVRLTL
jgi:signal transduction histidine kinase